MPASVALYIDTTTNTLIQSSQNQAIVSASNLPLFFGDTIAMTVQLFTRITNAAANVFPFQILSTAGLQLFLYLDDGTIAGTIYTQQITWTADPTNSFFSANLALNTAALQALVTATQPSGANCYLKIGYVQGGVQTTVLSQQVTINVGLPSSAVAPVAPGQTALSTQIAAATYVPINGGNPGQTMTLISPAGHKIELACVDNPDGSHSFQTIDLG